MLCPFDKLQSSMTLGLFFKDAKSFYDFKDLVATKEDIIRGAITINRETPDFILDEISPNEDEYLLL